MGRSWISKSTRGAYRVQSGKLYFMAEGMVEQFVSLHKGDDAAKVAARKHYNEEA